MNYLLALLKLISDMHFQRTVVASSFGCSLNEGVRLYCELQSLPIVGVSSRINQILLQRSPFVDLSVVFRPSPNTCCDQGPTLRRRTTLMWARYYLESRKLPSSRLKFQPGTVVIVETVHSPTYDA